jgi:Holliday junction DNA helicase RuvA
MLELKDRLSGTIRTEDAAVGPNARGDALRALLALGYSEKEANAALSNVSTELSVSEAIRHALKQLSKSS